ncbi:hypothetical protein HG15A2_44520 [Adhaeretor mobilis]|uniref:Uncharacterized protein n=1 Tax=Adhaeretor mobilis TaxID=1930276 RepID=A0A517N1U8_9BACT|nr:hypothetical protein HG15A2_44520 [Adhaeretor mobilis]
MLLKSTCLILASCCLAIEPYTLAQQAGSDEIFAAKKTGEVTMKEIIGNAKLMTKVKNDLLGGERLAMMVSHEIMVQIMLRDKQFMKTLQG